MRLRPRPRAQPASAVLYLSHFGLREAPFAITPDSAFFYPHDNMQAALDTLLVALRSGEGFLKIVGQVGCGKTVLCRHLLRLLQGEFVTAYIPNPDLGPDDLLQALAGELRLTLPEAGSRHQRLQCISECLLAHAGAGRAVLLCIDEAQAMPLPTLESLRLLSNLETEKRKLLQIVLLGQPELDATLMRPELRQLLQRITFSEWLGPLPPARVPAYLQHRLQTAAASDGSDLRLLFEPASVQALARASGGVPRLLNVLAHKCLLLAYGQNQHCITLAHANAAAADTPAVAAGSAWGRLQSAWQRWQRQHRQPWDAVASRRMP